MADSRASGSATFKLGALLLLAIPVGLLAMLLIGNFASGDPRTLGHVLLAVPLTLAMGSLWRWPREVGTILITAGLIALVANPLGHLGRPWQEILFVEMVIFVPPLMAGLLLRAAGRRDAAG